MSAIYEALEKATLASDGAMGTMLQDRGLTDGGAPELWNVERPEEIEAVLDAAGDAYPNRSIYLVFQPHRYTRSRDYFNEFVRVLHKADQVLLTDIYSAGEKMIPGVSSSAMMDSINKITNKVSFEKDITKLAKTALQNINQNSILIVMGAGSVGRVTKDILNIVNS